jgi:hypothetical protein
MADPNQTAQRGDWACPCSGCGKAVKWERKQLIQIFEEAGLQGAADIIKDRDDKKIR